MVKLYTALMLVLFSIGCASRNQPYGAFSAGPLCRQQQTTSGESRLTAAGPLYENVYSAGTGSFLALRPFYSRIDITSRDKTLNEFLWPLGMHKRLGNDLYWRFLNIYGNDFDITDDNSRFRAVFFPLAIYGRNSGGKNYGALFPLGGKIYDYLGRDELSFVLFPLYARSSVGEVETVDILWPIFSRTTGNDQHRFRLFPFYGTARRGEEYRKQFVLWPIWTHSRLNYERSRGTAWVLFPLCGRINYADQKGYMFLPPLFTWKKTDERTTVNCPWPLIQYSSGDVDKLYFWPLYGKKRSKSASSWFALWPIVSSSSGEYHTGKRFRFTIAPFINYSVRHTVRKKEGAKTEKFRLRSFRTDDKAPKEYDVSSRKLKIWPLCSYRRDGDEARFRALDLWPFSDVGPVERNYSPLWTLYSSVSNNGVTERSLLWGLFDYRVDNDGAKDVSLFPLFSYAKEPEADSAEYSLLWGFFGRKREGLQKEYRLLYFFKFRTNKEKE